MLLAGLNERFLQDLCCKSNWPVWGQMCWWFTMRFVNATYTRCHSIKSALHNIYNTISKKQQQQSTILLRLLDVRRWSDFQHWFYEWQEIISTVNIVICNYSSVLCSVSVDCISTIRRSHWTPYITPICMSRVKWSAEEYIDRIYTSTTRWQNVRRPTGQHWVLSARVRLKFIRVGLWRCENRCMFMTDIYWHNYVRLRIGSC